MASPIIWFGNKSKSLKAALQLDQFSTISSGATDPTSVALAGIAGDVYLSTITFKIYVKQDSGISLNWNPLGSFGSLTTGSVPFANASGQLIDDNSKFFWNDSTKRLGIGTNTPAQSLDVVGNGAFTGTISASNVSGTNTGDVTLTAFGSSPSAQGASLSGQALTLQPADGTHPGGVSTIAQSIAGSKTFSSLLNADGGIDRSAAGTLSIGGTNATVINIGNSGSTLNLQGTVITETTTVLNVTNPVINVNTGGGVGSGANSGVVVQENSIVTGYAETSSDRNSWIFKAPNTAGIATITPGASGITLAGSITSGTNSGTNTGDQTITLTSDVTGSGTGSFATTVAKIQGTTVSGTTGSGNVVFSTSPILVTPALGTPSSAVLTNATGLPLTSGVTGTLPIGNGGTGVTSLANFTDSSAGADGITVTGGTAAVIVATSISQQASNATHNGYLSSTDWSTFNAKQPAGSYITALTGDVTASGPGSSAATLATVNGNVGSFGSSTSIPSFTVNAKGLITAASGNVVVAPAGTLSGTTLNSTVVSSSLTSVGTLTTGVWNASVIPVLYGGTGTTTSTGTGSVVLSNSPTLVTPALGTPSAIVLTSGTGLPLTTGVTGVLPIANGGTGVSSQYAAKATVSGTLSVTANTAIAWPTTSYNLGSLITAGIATIPVGAGGIYQVTATTYNAANLNNYIYVNNVLASSSSIQGCDISDVFQLVAGDTVDIRVDLTTTLTSDTTRNRFTITKIA